jgi:hypothetical protein
MIEVKKKGEAVMEEKTGVITKEPKEDVVLKHRGTIEITNSSISRIQRLAWNLLLLRAFRSLLVQETHEVAVWDIAKALGYYDLEELKQQLRELQALQIEYNIAATNTWGVTGYLAEAEIKDGTLRYAYGPIFRQYLAHPDFYARIQLSVEYRFKSKYSVILYEIAASYYISKLKWGATVWYDVATLRRLFGCDKTEYQAFLHFNAKVIKKAVKEVNLKSDLYVTVGKKRSQKAITHIRFIITPQPNAKKMFSTVTESEQLELPMEGSILYNRLVVEFHLTPAQALEIVHKYDYPYIQEKLTYVATRMEDIENLPAFAYAAITQDYTAGKSLASDKPDKTVTVEMPMLAEGTLIGVEDKVFRIDESGTAYGDDGVIPPGMLRGLIKSGKATILSCQEDGEK